MQRNPNKRRDDSPLRWPATVHHTTTHDERIRWLWYENSKMYEELYNHLSSLQGKSLSIHKDYLCNNELAQTIYEKKYFLKDLNSECIESCPEDVFKRLASFIAVPESTKNNQKKWFIRNYYWWISRSFYYFSIFWLL